ncbi:MAG: hypothetical protein ACI93L_001911, partial [Cyclobacteriaceae bacterium]
LLDRSEYSSTSRGDSRIFNNFFDHFVPVLGYKTSPTIKAVRNIKLVVVQG